MPRLLFALTLVLAAASSSAQTVDATAAEADPLGSTDCRAALDSLRAQEAAAASAAEANTAVDPHRRRAPAAALEAARRRAAGACLATRADPPPRPQRFGRPPIAVDPVTPAAPNAAPGPVLSVAPVAGARPAAPPAAPVVTLPKPAEAPRFILSCDPVGCWANDGSRLNRVGPNLWGGHGACSVQGTLLLCP
ncbi:MAG: hypothetical protein ABI809_05855 [Caldimonas sp.]